MQSQIEKQVMGNIAAIYLMRRLASLTAIKLYVVGASLAAIADLVSVPHVFMNLMHVGPAGFATFVLSAALNTKLLVQLGLLASIVVGVSFVIDTIRAHTERRDHRFAL